MNKRMVYALALTAAAGCVSPVLAADGTVAAVDTLLASDARIDLQPEQPAIEPAAQEAPGFFKGWDGNVEVGLNGSSGNSENLNFRALVGLNRSTESMDTTLTFLYRYAENDDEETENRFRVEGRNDWKFGEDSRWVFFAQGSAEWDEFQDWDWRFAGSVGPGYYFIKNDKTTLLGRVGLGGSYETGGEDNDFRPEGLIGLDFTHKITERQEFSASTEYLPSLEDLGEYRWNSNARWKVTVDPEANLFLSVGIDHRYDSEPGEGFDESDFDFFVTLGWEF